MNALSRAPSGAASCDLSFEQRRRQKYWWGSVPQDSSRVAARGLYRSRLGDMLGGDAWHSAWRLTIRKRSGIPGSITSRAVCATWVRSFSAHEVRGHEVS